MSEMFEGGSGKGRGLLAFAVLIGACAIGYGVYEGLRSFGMNTKQLRCATVHVDAVRKVSATRGGFSFKCKVEEANIADMNSKIKHITGLIRGFLESAKVRPEEISFSIIDGADVVKVNRRNHARVVVFHIQSDDPVFVKKLHAQALSSFMNDAAFDGITVGQVAYTDPNLSDVKEEMLQEAMGSAKESAKLILTDCNHKLVELVYLKQGKVEIEGGSDLQKSVKMAVDVTYLSR